MAGLHCRVQTNYLEVIMVKGEKISAPFTLLHFNQAVALVLDLVLGDGLIAGTK